MCPDRFSLSFQIFKTLLSDAERILPGKGCDLITALAAVSDVALIVGVLWGLALAWLFHDVYLRIVNSRRYRVWKAERHAD